MKIAAITDDGTTISQHFGRAAHYLVATVENGQIIKRELRDKLGHGQFHGGAPEHGAGQEPHEHGGHHGAEAHEKHARMSDAIADCEALLCRGMGRGAYEHVRARGIRPVVTDIASIDEAVLAYAAGLIEDHTERLH